MTDRFESVYEREWNAIVSGGVDKVIIRIMKEYLKEELRCKYRTARAISVYLLVHKGDLYFEYFADGKYELEPFDWVLYREIEDLLMMDRYKKFIFDFQADGV